MTFTKLNGKTVNKNLTKYKIDWSKPCRSKIQFQVKQFLKQYWKNHLVYEEVTLAGTMLKIDIFNATLRIGLEINGPQHSSYHYFHNGNPLNYLKAIKNDNKKSEWLELNKIKLCEINFDEIDLLSKEFFKEKFGVIL